MNKINNILFLSSVCSDKVFDYVLNTSLREPGQAIQKQHALLVTGLAMHKNNVVETLTSAPIAPDTNKKRFWNLKSELIKDVNYKYIPTINFPIIKNIIDSLYAFFMIMFWKPQARITRRIVICDALKLSIVVGAYFSCKLRKIKLIGMFTDMPGLNIGEYSFKETVKTNITRLFLTRYDGYILSTIHMNSIVNSHLKPIIVLEGLVDINMAITKNQAEKKDKEKIILYSGGIYERYGIKNLIEAFMKLDNKDIKLDIYGSGPMGSDMPKYMAKDSRIRYFGLVPNEVVAQRQIRATLLVNPRPSTEEYTKYSFPSKNTEYMVSGTPIVTTRLPGIPDEYFPFVYLFKNESIEGIYKTLKDLLNKPDSELHNFGYKAKNFVLSYKNNFEQARLVNKLLDQLF